MASSLELQMLAKARRRRAEAEGAPSNPAFAAASDASQTLSGGPGPTPPPPEPSWIEQALGYAGETGAIMADSARRGVSNIAGLPVDLINASPLVMRLFGVDAQPFSEKPVGGSAFLNDATKGFGLIPDAPEPEDPLQTILGRIAEEVGATAVPGAGILAKAGQLGVQGARQAGGLTRHFIEPAAVNPANFVGKEVAAATAAGTGAGIANTMVDRDTTGGQWADLLGALAGVGVAGVGGAVGKSLGDVLAATTNNPKYASEVVRQNAADTVIANSDTLGSQVDPARPHDPVDTTSLVELLERPSVAENVIPGFKASTADRSADFGLASLEDARTRGPNAGRFRAVSENNTSAIETALDTYRPTEQPGTFRTALDEGRADKLATADGDYQEALGALNNTLGPLEVGTTPAARGNTVRTELEGARSAARANTDAMYDAADTSGNMVSPTELARTIDNATANLTAAERSLVPESMLERVRALGDPKAADGAGRFTSTTGRPLTNADGTPFSEADFENYLAREKARADRYRDVIADGEAHGEPDSWYQGQFSSLARIPLKKGETWKGRMEGLVKDYDNWAGSQPSAAVPPDPVDLREATTLLSEIKRMERAALADPRAEKGGRNAARVLGQISDALDDFITANVTPEQRVALDRARAAKFDEAERFTRAGDPIAAALDRYEGGQPRMRDERVAASFASNDQNLERLLTEADTPATRTAIREELLSRLDTTSVDKMLDFTGVYSQQLRRFPGLEDEVRAAAQARAGESAVGLQRSEMQKLFGTPDGTVPGRNDVAKYLQYDDTQAERAMSGVLNAKSPAATIDELLTFVGDEASAVEGARAAFWRVMEKQGKSRNGAFETAAGTEPWMPKKWRTFLDQPNVSAVMERLYRDNPEHLANIRQIAEALRGVNTGKKAGAAINPSGSAQTLRNGPVTLAEAQAKFIDVQRGRLNPLYAVTYLAGKIANRLVSKQAERAYQMLLDEALMNPQVAAELLRQNNPANRAALARKAKGWLGNEASNLTELLSGGEPDEQGDEDDDVVNLVVRGGSKKEAE